MAGKQPSNNLVVFGGSGIIAVVAIVGAVGIWNQLKTPNEKQPITKPVATASVAASAASAAFDPVTAPAIDYTQYTPPVAAQPASGVSSGTAPGLTPPVSTPAIPASAPLTTVPAAEPAIKTVKEPEKSVVVPTKADEKKEKTIKPKAKETVQEPVQKIEKPSKPVTTNAEPATTPKGSDFTYVQPNAEKAIVPKAASTPASAAKPKPTVTTALDARNSTMQKVQAFEPTVVETVGDRAWIKISPTNTVIVEKGQEFESLGKLLNITGTEVVFEKSTLPVPKSEPTAK